MRESRAEGRRTNGQPEAATEDSTTRSPRLMEFSSFARQSLAHSASWNCPTE